MTKVLCVSKEDYSKQVEESKNGVATELHKVRFVERDICEKQENGWLQYVPYMTVYVNDSSSGKVAFLVYNRPDKGEGESRLKGKASIGFGGHVEEQDYLSFMNVGLEEEDKITSVPEGDIELTKHALTGIIAHCADRELKEEIGFSLTELVTDLTNEPKIDLVVRQILDENDTSGVNEVHLCCSSLLEVSPTVFHSVLTKNEEDNPEVEKLSYTEINYSAILQRFNVEKDVTQASAEIASELNMELWSKTSLISLLYTRMGEIVSKISYSDLFIAYVNALAAETTDELQEPAPEETETQEPTA